MIDLGTIAGLHEHDHQLAAYCPRCDAWRVLPLGEWVSQGKGSLRLPLRVRCRDCGEVGAATGATACTNSAAWRVGTASCGRREAAVLPHNADDASGFLCGRLPHNVATKLSFGNHRGTSMIESYGLHWRVDRVFWGRQRVAGTLLGAASRSPKARPVDFRQQRRRSTRYTPSTSWSIGWQTGAAVIAFSSGSKHTNPTTSQRDGIASRGSELSGSRKPIDFRLIPQQ